MHQACTTDGLRYYAQPTKRIYNAISILPEKQPCEGNGSLFSDIKDTSENHSSTTEKVFLKEKGKYVFMVFRYTSVI